MDQFSNRFFADNKEAVYRNADVLENYTNSNFFNTVNGELRSGEISMFVTKHLEQFLHVLDRVKPIENEYILYRGMGSFDPFRDSEYYIDKGIASKTTSLRIAEYFTEERGFLLEIKYPKGTKQIYMAPISGADDEEEFFSYPAEVLKMVSKVITPNYTKYICIFEPSEFEYPPMSTSLDEKIEKIIFPIIDIYYKAKRLVKVLADNNDIMETICKTNIYEYLYTAVFNKNIKLIELITPRRVYKFNLY